MIARARPLVDEALAGAWFLWGLRSFLRPPLDVPEARATVRRRLEHRTTEFLALVRAAVYANPSSPYRQLLALAGCEYGDLERLVTRDGLEDALRALLQQGVYLTVDELKGRRAAVRGSARIAVEPSRLRNPLTGPQVWATSSGSRGAGTPVPFNFAFVHDGAVNKCLPLEARGGRRWRHAHWDVPRGALTSILGYAKAGAAPTRWFSPVDVATAALHPRYRWSARAMRWGSRLAGVALPAPEHVPIDDPLPIARWMTAVRETGEVPHLITYPSPAVRLCQAAAEAGTDLRGVQFSLYGEPLTHARLAAIHEVGADAIPIYVATESGRIAEGCLRPESPDELHLFDDLHGVVHAGADGGARGLPGQALLLTSLRATAPLVLLNVSMGDLAAISRRACGCRMEALGWPHGVRSFEKLTAGGMTFLDSDVIRVLDEILPARFGGGPTHYQVVEEEAGDGKPRVRLLIHPAVGPLDTAAVAEAFLAAISPGSGAERMMGLVWRDARLLRVERRPPLTTASGKILHLHAQPATSPPGIEP